MTTQIVVATLLTITILTYVAVKMYCHGVAIQAVVMKFPIFNILICVAVEM